MSVDSIQQMININFLVKLKKKHTKNLVANSICKLISYETIKIFVCYQHDDILRALFACKSQSYLLFRRCIEFILFQKETKTKPNNEKNKKYKCKCKCKYSVTNEYEYSNTTQIGQDFMLYNMCDLSSFNLLYILDMD